MPKIDLERNSALTKPHISRFYVFTFSNVNFTERLSLRLTVMAIQSQNAPWCQIRALLHERPHVVPERVPQRELVLEVGVVGVAGVRVHPLVGAQTAMERKYNWR